MLGVIEVDKDINILYERLGYRFVDPSTLIRALTHKSLSKDNYERLEFLGDSILNYGIASLLFQEYCISEGELSISRAHLVNKVTLSRLGKALKIDSYIRASSHQAISPSIRSDVVEAVIGAIYIDGGLEAALSFIKRQLSDQIKNLSMVDLKDAKTSLQEWAHQNNYPPPSYTVLSATGKQHEKIYTIQCGLGHKLKTQAEGMTKQEASQKSASILLKQMVVHE